MKFSDLKEEHYSDSLGEGLGVNDIFKNQSTQSHRSWDQKLTLLSSACSWLAECYHLLKFVPETSDLTHVQSLGRSWAQPGNKVFYDVFTSRHQSVIHAAEDEGDDTAYLRVNILRAYYQRNLNVLLGSGLMRPSYGYSLSRPNLLVMELE